MPGPTNNSPFGGEDLTADFSDEFQPSEFVVQPTEQPAAPRANLNRKNVDLEKSGSDLQISADTRSTSQKQYDESFQYEEQEEGRYRKPHISVIEGWKEKKYCDLPKLNSFTPFIKLFSIFDQLEVQMYLDIMDKNRLIREDPNAAVKAGIELFDPKLPEGFINSMSNATTIEFAPGGDQHSKRVIQSILSKSSADGGGGIYAYDMTVALPQGPYNNWDGGFGVIDMQSSRMTETPFVENFSMKIQLNNPRLIKERYEYNKLITVGSHFLVMYGWSDGTETGVYDTAENKIVLDTNSFSFYNFGYWRWAFIQLHKFDLNFNNLGQLEGTLDFISAQNSDIIFNMNTKMNRISQYSTYFLKSRFLGGAAGLERAESSVGQYSDQGVELDVEVAATSNVIDAAGSAAGFEASGFDQDTTGDEVGFQNMGPHRRVAFYNVSKAMSGDFGDTQIFLFRKSAHSERFFRDLYRVDSNDDKTDWNVPLGDGILSAAFYVKGRGLILANWFNTLSDGPANDVGQENNEAAIHKSQAMSETWVNQRPPTYGPYAVRIKILSDDITDESAAKDSTDGQVHTISGTSPVIRYIYPINTRVINLGDSNDVKKWDNSTGLSPDDLLYDRVKFAGHEIFDEIKDLLPGNVRPEDFYELSEGVTVVTMADEGRRVVEEQMAFYHLGWIILSLQHYNRKMGGANLNVRYGELNGRMQDLARQNFRFAATEATRTVFQEASKGTKYGVIAKPILDPTIPEFNIKNFVFTDIDLYTRYSNDYFNRDGEDNDNWKEIDYFFNSIQRVTGDMVKVFEGTRKDAWAGENGLYLEELKSFFGGDDLITSQTNIGLPFWTDPDPNNRIQYLIFPNIELPVGLNLLWERTIIHMLNFIWNKEYESVNNIIQRKDIVQSGTQWAIQRRGEDMFIPYNMPIPFLKPDRSGNARRDAAEGDDEGTVEAPDTTNVVSNTFLSGIQTGRIDKIWKVPMDANKVDDLLEGSVGTTRTAADIITKLLTDCCAIDGLNLTATTKQDGSLIIEATGGMSVSEQQFNLDYTEEELDELSEGENFILDYRTKNSLIVDLKVAGSMDPNISFLYGNAVRQPNSKKTTLSLINKRFNNNPNADDFTMFAKNWLYRNQARNDASVIVTQLNNSEIYKVGVGTVNDPAQLDELLEKLPDDLFSAYLAQDYRLYEEVQVQQMNENNSINSLFTYYMNQITAKIHGTTGLECYEIIQLKNVADLIDGFYCIIGTTDSISSSDFNTELKLMLLAPSTSLEGRLQT